MERADNFEMDVLSGAYYYARAADSYLDAVLDALRAGRLYGKTWIGEEWTAQTGMSNLLRAGRWMADEARARRGLRMVLK